MIGSLVGFTAPAASAPSAAVVGGTFSSSFEATEAPAQVSTQFSDPVNVTGRRFGPGSLLGHVIGVDASAQNIPKEGAINLADANSSSKWLAFVPTASITYTLDAPQVVRQYKLTSADDSEGRDPKDWTVQGSHDGTTWVTIDTRTGEDFTSRFATNTYTATNTTAYSRYRLDITANSGDGLTQLADWEILDGTNDLPPASTMLASVGNGPTSGPTIKAGVGFTGVKALQYGGAHLAAGAASSTDVLYDIDTAIGDDTELAYKVFPVLNNEPAHLDYSATYIAVDLLLDDGTRLSAKNLVDQYGFPATASGQGSEKALYVNQWNAVRVDLSSLAGKRVDKVLLSYDNPGGTATTAFSGWLDDVSVTDAVAIDASSRTNYVDTRRGTNASGSFSRGNNIPATAVPNGFNFYTPMTDGGSGSWLYNYASSNNGANLPTLQALGISHEPSPWMGDREQLAILPSLSAGVPNASLGTRALSFSHDDEVAQPDLYSVEFTNGIEAKVTPTDHSAIYSFTFPAANNVGTLIVDEVSGDSELAVSADGMLTGWVENGSGNSAGHSRMFIYGQFDAPSTGRGTATGRTSATYANFDTSTDKTLELRIATSFISRDQAKANLGLEVSDKTFEAVREAARSAWNDRLSVIDVEGATQTELVSLYSDLYRLNLYPNSQSENTGTAADPAWKYASPVSAKTGAATATTTNAKVVDGKIYVNNGFWDTYRTVWPLYSLLYPDVAEELVDGFVQQYRDGGWIARWSSPGYADLMTGTSSDASFAEAYVSGALPTDLALEAYDAALKNATVLPTSNAVGRKGLDTSQFLGYTSTATGESVSWGLEGYINDYAIGKMAQKLADDPATPAERVSRLKDEAKYFSKRAQDYVNMFDPEVDFFQGKTVEGDFAQSADEFDPTEWGHDYTETNGWNFAFHAPFDPDGLAALYGGTDALVSKLDEFFTTPEVGATSAIHERFEARDVRMGQFGMSNQVSHHIPYMYSGAGDPSKTQEKVREIMQRLFVGSEIGQGYPGDEDNGEMSSWYIFSALGFYPLALASGEYTVGSPLFDKTTVHLDGGDLVINATNNSTENVYIQSATLNGEALKSATLDQSSLKGGAELTFVMGSQPSAWGDRTSDGDQTRTPYVDSTSKSTGAVWSSDDTPLIALVDDNSRSAVTFDSDTPAVTWESASGPAAIASYTITNGPTGDSPTAWTLSASNDGSSWTQLDERSNETFTWATQTRPFQVSEPRLFTRYKLEITATSGGEAPTLSELELLADTLQQSEHFELFARPGLEGDVDAAFTAAYATFTGGSSSAASDYEATVDFLDGNGAQSAEISKSKLGSLQVSLDHTWRNAGVYPVRVTVIDGESHLSGVATVTVSRDDSFEGALGIACITSPGTAVDCDGNGYGYDKASLAANGYVQGALNRVPGTDLTFDAPATRAGENDTVVARGQRIRLHLSPDATKFSVIGTANEGAQHGTARLTFDDGTTQDVAIDFGDWVGSANSPAFDNVVVGKSLLRLRGTGAGDSQAAAIFSTKPIDLPEGKQAVSITLPNQAGTLKGGLIHVFAFASDGVRTAPQELVVHASDSTTVASGVVEDAELATVVGGSPLASGFTATVNWGDETPVEESNVNAGIVSGSHHYRAPGVYTVSITVDDGEKSVTKSTEITVEAVYTPELSISDEPVAPGASASVSGSGFKPGESVEIVLGSTPAVTRTVTADGDGSFTTSVGVPADAVDGTYPATATGTSSHESASEQVIVATPKKVTSIVLAVSSQKIELGDTVTVTAALAGATAGSIDFFDGTVHIGSAPVLNAKATIAFTGVVTGMHSITARFDGDESSLPSASAAAMITVTKGAVTLAAPTFSKASQVFSSSSVASVSTTVTGAKSGTVTFSSGTRVLGTSAIGASGTASAKLSKTLAAGTYPVVASFSETETSSASTSSAVSFTVQKATTSKVTVTGKKFAKNTRPVVKVKVAKLNSGAHPAGEVSVWINGKKVRTVSLVASQHGKVKVALPQKYSRTITVKAKFTAESVVKKVSKPVRLTVR